MNAEKTDKEEKHGIPDVKKTADEIFNRLQQDYDIFAPKLFAGEGCFSDTDVIRYGKIHGLDKIEWERISDCSFKEVLLTVNEILFYFTGDQTTVPACKEKSF